MNMQNGDKIYYIKRAKLTLYIRKLDKNGNPVPKINPISLAPVIMDGRQQYEEEIIRFANKYKGHGKGNLAYYIVKGDDPQEIKDFMENYAESPATEVMTEEAYEKSINPERYEEKQKRIALEDKIAKLQQENNQIKEDSRNTIEVKKSNEELKATVNKQTDIIDQMRKDMENLKKKIKK